MKRVRDDAMAMEEEDNDLLLHEEEGEEGYGSQLVACDVLLSLACGTPTPYGEDAVPRKQLRRRRRRRRRFECRTCGRRFASFQALGGHRTSHLRPSKRRASCLKPVVHACGVCGLGFEMGQALGGHMRRHRAGKTDGGADLALKRIMAQESRPSSALQLLDLFV